MPDTLTDNDRAAIRAELEKKIEILRDEDSDGLADSLRRDPAANIQDDAIPLTFAYAIQGGALGFLILLGHVPAPDVLHFSILLDNNDERAIVECMDEIADWVEDRT